MYQAAPHVLQYLVFLTLFALLAGSTWASEPYDEIQRRDLALIQSQLGQVTTVLSRLEQRQAAQTEPMQLYLDLPRLKTDLQTILNGLDDYLSPSRMPPRQLDQLDQDLLGEYVRRSQ